MYSPLIIKHPYLLTTCTLVRKVQLIIPSAPGSSAFDRKLLVLCFHIVFILRVENLYCN